MSVAERETVSVIVCVSLVSRAGVSVMNRVGVSVAGKSEDQYGL